MEQSIKKEFMSEHAIGEYLALPKEIGAASPDRLLEIAGALLLDERFTASDWITQPKMVAASALTEAALISNETTSIDERLRYIDLAEELTKEIADAELRKLEAGHEHPDNIEAWQRAELRSLFMDSYRDIVCGEVTLNRTKPELITNLQTLYDSLDQQRKLAYVSSHRKQESTGLMGEISVLIDTWQHYRSPEDPIALPSTYRGGNGIHNHRHTHDVVFASQSPEMPITYWEFSYAEVKTAGGYQLQDLRRYAHPILRVTDSGTKKVA